MDPTLPFTLAEYERRLKAVRQGMGQRGIDVLLTSVPENICSTSPLEAMGYFTYQILIVSLEAEPVFLTRSLNVDKAHSVHAYGMWKGGTI